MTSSRLTRVTDRTSRSRIFGFLAALVLAVVATPGRAQGKVFMKIPQALALAFPKCKIERQSLVLTATQQQAITKLSGKKFPRRIVFPHVATKNGKVVGTAYFDKHRVRTLNQVLMVVVTPAARIRRIEILAFAEPTQYIAPRRWYAQFKNRQLDKKLRLRRGIRGVTGATLTARATTVCARRTLALHKVLHPPKATGSRAESRPRSRPGSRPTSRPVPVKESK